MVLQEFIDLAVLCQYNQTQMANFVPILFLPHELLTPVAISLMDRPNLFWNVATLAHYTMHCNPNA